MSLDAAVTPTPPSPEGRDSGPYGQATLFSLLSSSGPSARLRSAMRDNPEFFRSRSVAVYRADPLGFRKALLDLKKVGATTVDEVDSILLKCDPDLAARLAVPAPEPQAMPGWLMALDVSKVGLVAGFSTRLESALKNDRPRTVGDYVRDPEDFKATLLRAPNFGRKSLAELVELLETVLADGAVPDPHRPFDVRRSDVSHGFERARRMIFGISSDPKGDLEASLLGLRERYRDVLLHRYGALGRRRMTLEEISATWRVTRERVRQMENKAVDALSTTAVKGVCESIVEGGARAAWDDLSQGEPMVPFMGIGALARRRIDPLFQIAARIAYGGVREWLDGFFEKEGLNWVEPSEDAERSDAILTALAGMGDVALPQALSRIGLKIGFDPRHVEQALRVPWDFATFEGYLVRKPTADVRRVVRLHALAMALPDPVFDCKTLFLRYRESHRDPSAVSNLGALVMEQNPQLFLRLYDGVYVTIGHPAGPCADPSLPFEGSGAPVEAGDAEGLRVWMESLLARSGPMSLVAVADRAAAHFGESTVVRNVWPTAHVFRTFRRELPGVVGVYGGKAPDWSDPAFLAQAFNPTAVDVYLISRRSGEKRRLYPLWDGAYERRMCEWLRADPSRDDAYASAISVSDMDLWDVDPFTRAAWGREGKGGGRWMMPGVDDGSALFDGFSPEDVLKASFHLSRIGALSLPSVNRIIGARRLSPRGLALMALLAASGMGVATGDASQGVSPGPALGERRAELEAELAERGWLSWASGFGADVLRSALEGSSRADLGWPGGDRVRALVAGLRR